VMASQKQPAPTPTAQPAAPTKPVTTSQPAAQP
jgi:hypothetical protein